MDNQWYYIGEVVKTHGIHGEVLVKVDKPSFFIEKGFVFIEIHKEQIPFLIFQIRERSEDALLIRFEDIGTVEQASAIVGAAIYGTAVEAGEELYLDDLLKYSLYKGDDCIGSIIDYIDTGKQILLVVQNNVDESEIYIPFVDDYILAIDDVEKKCIMQLPEGLIELNS